ncbi:16944_t:CDS:2, partial [Funneliformis geosporum]
LANIQEDLSAPAEMIMSPGDLKAYNEATEYWICKGPFLKPAPEVVQKLEEAKHNLLEIKEWESCMKKEHPKKKEAQKKYREALSGLNRKVKDHDHINGNYRGPAHDSCNKKLRIGSFKTKVPLICHNFRGYDSHPLMKVVSKFTADKLNCIPENIGKYKAMDVGQLRFLDSFQHMAMGLDKLVACLGENPEKFPLTVKHFTAKGYSIEKIKLLFRKGVFPYDWTNAWEKFDRTSLPPRKEFYSILSQQNISKEDYKYAQKIWQTFEMQSFGDYHDLYLETDVLLLADVFMNYTIMCLQDDGLDPSHYVSAPGMFNDSLYKSREVPDIQSIAPDAEIGYMLEIDLEAPVHLHDYFADYPLAPEKQIVPEKWLSLYNERLVHDKEVEGGKYTTGEKLVQTLYPKKNYVVHYRALQLYMKLGMKVTKIHGALKFWQSPWMKDYIEENIHKRKIAKANGDEFGIMYYKLKNNAVFGKQMENVRKHMRVELLRTEEDKKIRRLASSPLATGIITVKNIRQDRIVGVFDYPELSEYLAVRSN